MNAKEKDLYNFICKLHANIYDLKDFCISKDLTNYYQKLADYIRLFEHKLTLGLVAGDYDGLKWTLFTLYDTFENLRCEIHNSVHISFDPDADQD